MKITLALLCTIFSMTTFAQLSDLQRIEDSIIGWKTTYSFKGKTYKPLMAEGKNFSVYQQSLRDTFITWMQRTYLPIGGFGDIYQRNFTTRQSKGPVPQGIGMDALIYGMNKNERTGKYEMTANEDHNDVSIYTNALAGINNAQLFSTPEQFFFTMPRDNYGATFTDKNVIDIVKDYGLHNGDRFSKYMVYFPSKSSVTVVLIPGNKLPIVQLTKGEVLVQCEKGLAREAANRKDAKQYQQCIKNLNYLKEKYKNKLHEPAVLYAWAGPSYADFVNNETTLFVEDWYQQIPGYPVYRFTKEAIDSSKRDKPLWISITWEPRLPNTRVKPYEVHRAMMRYFNFDYVYDYFFNPEKVKGRPYTVANAGEQLAHMQQLRKHYTVADNKPVSPGSFFADDFSSNAEGVRPAGWSDSRNRTPASVVSLKTKPGKWVKLGHMNELSPSIALTKPLPENFTLEFDVETDEFSVRTGGSVLLSLNSNQTSLQFLITAGNEADYNNNNYSGTAKPAINSSVAGYDGGYNLSYALKEFSNKKTSLHATVKVKNEQVAFFINNKQIAPATGIPPNTQFRKISFMNNTQNWSPDGKSDAVNVYISNVKIVKD